MVALPLALATQLLQALTAKDKAAALALFTDDAVLLDPHYPNPEMIGKAAIGEGLDFAFGLLKQPGWTILRSWEDTTSVVLEVDTRHELINGMVMTPRQVFVIDTKGGKITRWQSFAPYPPPQATA